MNYESGRNDMASPDSSPAFYPRCGDIMRASYCQLRDLLPSERAKIRRWFGEQEMREMDASLDAEVRLEDRADRIDADRIDTVLRILWPALWLLVGCLVGSLVTALWLAAVLP